MILGVHYHVLRLKVSSKALRILVKLAILSFVVESLGVALVILDHHLNLLVHILLVLLLLLVFFVLLQAHFDVVM